MSDPDPIGLDGTVRLRCYLPSAETHYFAGTCRGCPREVLIGVEAAIGMTGSGAATIGELQRRLVCRCGGRVDLRVAVDNRTPEWIRQEGRLPETMGLVVRG